MTTAGRPPTLITQEGNERLALQVALEEQVPIERRTPRRDPVDDYGAASFPASDPPSWWAGA
jgi:hypothetical protein